MSEPQNDYEQDRDDALIHELLSGADQLQVDPPAELVAHVQTRGQMTEAVREKPWIRMKDKRHESEVWFSFSQDIAAQRSKWLVRYDDYQKGLRHEYDPREKKLLCLPLSMHDAGSFQSLVAVFQAIFRGDATVGEQLAEDSIVRQRMQTVEDRGRSWIQYELELQRGNQTDSVMAVIQVDPATMLPVTMTINAPSEKVEFAIDYPEEGPADIYALGVRRDVPVEDRHPSADLTRILDAVDRGRHKLDNYFAIVCKPPQFGDVRLVSRKGANGE